MSPVPGENMADVCSGGAYGAGAGRAAARACGLQFRCRVRGEGLAFARAQVPVWEVEGLGQEAAVADADIITCTALRIGTRTDSHASIAVPLTRLPLRRETGRCEPLAPRRLHQFPATPALHRHCRRTSEAPVVLDKPLVVGMRLAGLDEARRLAQAA